MLEFPRQHVVEKGTVGNAASVMFRKDGSCLVHS